MDPVEPIHITPCNHSGGWHSILTECLICGYRGVYVFPCNQIPICPKCGGQEHFFLSDCEDEPES